MLEIKELPFKLKTLVGKYKYAIIVLAIGIVLLMIPSKESEKIQTDNNVTPQNQEVKTEQLAQILQSIEGAGKTEVLLSIASGEETIYQTNHDSSTSGDENSTKVETVIITDSQRNESGLITQINPPTYLGAIVVCQGADSAAVRLSITQAVSKITGLGTDEICVLKMK